jgi:Tfp pilus assembly protein PilF
VFLPELFMAENDLLQGWNAIAEFLNCDVRTAKRWETERGLPIRRTRRTPGEGRPNVCALVSEIEQWRAGSSSGKPQAPTEELAQPTELVKPAEPAELAQHAPVTTLPDHALQKSRAWLLGALTILIACAAIALSWARERKTRAAANELPKQDQPALHDASAQVRNLYLHGNYLLEQRTPETLAQAKSDYEQAIARDANFAPAYAGLAETYDLLRQYSTLPSDEAYPQAKQAAEHAIALDPDLADAHAALGYEEFFWEWDRPKAEAEFQRAITLAPHSANAALWYGSMLMHEARFKEALEQLDRAQMLEPASPSVLAIRAYAMALSGRRDEAANLLQDILARTPDAPPLHLILAQLYLQQPRDIPRFLDQSRRYAELRHSGEDLQLLDAAEPAYRNEGEQAMWHAMLKTEGRLHPGSRTYAMAMQETALGMNDAAIHDLQLLAKQHDDHMIGLRIDTLLTPLRTDPRFKALEHQVGLPN